MNTHHLFTYFLLSFVLVSTIQGLTFKATRQELKTHLREENKFTQQANEAQPKSGSSHKSQLSEEHMGTNFANQLQKFIKNNKDLSEVKEGETYKSQAVKKLKKFVKNNAKFKKEFSQIFKNPAYPQCVKNFKKQKEEILNIVLNSMNAKVLIQKLNWLESISDPLSIQQIQDELRNNKKLGDKAAQCFGKVLGKN